MLSRVDWFAVSQLGPWPIAAIVAFFIVRSWQPNLGSIVEPRDLAAIAAEIDRWLSMSAEGRAEFTRRATEYMTRNLSMDGALARRFAIWEERLHTRADVPTHTHAV